MTAARQAARAAGFAFLLGTGIVIASGAVATAAPHDTGSSPASTSDSAAGRATSPRAAHRSPSSSVSAGPARVNVASSRPSRGSQRVITLRLPSPAKPAAVEQSSVGEPSATPTAQRTTPSLPSPKQVQRAVLATLDGLRRDIEFAVQQLTTTMRGQASASVVTAAPALPGPDTPGVYGNPAKYATYWRLQKGNTCVLMSSAQLIGQLTGAMPDPNDIIREASQIDSKTYTKGRFFSNLWNKQVVRSGAIYDPLNDEYVYYDDAMKLLENHGITSTATYYTPDQGDRALADLTASLADGKAVMVSIHGRVTASIVRNWSRPGGFLVGNHAVTVLGIDTTNRIVYINDTALVGGQGLALSYDDFLSAWKPSRYLMVAAELASTQTQAPAASEFALAA